MEYVVELELAVPVERVAAALMDPEHWPAWQRGLTLVVTEPGTGAPGRGTRRRLEFSLPGWSTVMEETLLEQEFPTRYAAIYTSGPAWNLCEHTLATTPDEGTRWTQRNSWRFDDVTAGPEDAERFAATTRASMDALRAYVERGERVPAAG